MSVGRAMSLRDFKKYVAKVRKNLTGADGAMVKGIHSGVMRSLTVVHKAVDNAPPASDNGKVGAVDTGGYKLRWHFYLTRTGGGLRNSHPAADVIERGRRAGRKAPPVRVIEEWARRRLGLSKAEAAKAKWPIRAAIAKRGLQGRRVLTSTSTKDEITRVVMEEIKREVKAALRKSSGK